MNRQSRHMIGLCCLLILAIASPAAAGHQQEMTGTWLLEVDLDVGSGTATLVLTQEGDEIAGTYSGTLGEEVPVEGKVTEEGIEVSFDSQAGKVTYAGKLEEGVFQGTCEYGQLGSGTFKGEKQQTP